MYPNGRELWRNWPRSLPLRDQYAGVAWALLGLAEVALVQALPLPLCALLLALKRFRRSVPRNRDGGGSRDDRSAPRAGGAVDAWAPAWLMARELSTSWAMRGRAGTLWDRRHLAGTVCGDRAGHGRPRHAAHGGRLEAGGPRGRPRLFTNPAAWLAGLVGWLWMLNLALAMARLGVLIGTARAYRRVLWSYWLSPLCDGPAALALCRGALRRRHTWRGRVLVLGGTS